MLSEDTAHQRHRLLTTAATPSITSKLPSSHYVDHSSDRICDLRYFQDEEKRTVRSSPSSETESLNFPRILHRILAANGSEDGTDGVVAWKSHGRAFQILNQTEFENTVMPQ